MGSCSYHDDAYLIVAPCTSRSPLVMSKKMSFADETV